MLCKYIMIDRRQTLLLTVTKKNIVNNVQTLQETVIYVRTKTTHKLFNYMLYK